jgi:hypothetical protein
MIKQYTFEEARDAFAKQTEITQRLIRRFASQRLIAHGAAEVGSSDINHEMHNIYSEYAGDYEDAVMDFVNIYLIK